MKGCLSPFLVMPVALLVGCSTAPKAPPEPIIKTIEIKVPVPVPCKALEKLGPEPAYPDTDAALRDAPNIFERVKLLVAGRLVRIQRAVAVEAALNSCGQ